MTESVTTHFGHALRRLRLAAGLSQEELAERAGLSARGVRALEAGHRTRPRPDTVRMLAAGLELDEAGRTAFIASARPELGGLGLPIATDEAELVVPAAAPPVHRRLTPPPLPVPPTRLIGREREVAAICGFLGREDREPLETVHGRLLTLTGPGGVGKTRLALAAAHELTGAFDATAWVELASLRIPASVSARVASVLGVSDARGSPTTALIDALRQHDVLLAIDNCEHLLAPTAGLVADLLAACPRLVVLATSRERLRLRGERAFVVDPLSIPRLRASRAAAGAGEREPAAPDPGLAGVAAVRLFVERAAEAAPGFTLTAANADAVTELCRRMDGLPLAVELAAARVRVLSPEAMLARFERRLQLLRGGARDLPVRQQTMRDAIAWSCELLSEEEHLLFGQLAVFVGGCTLDGAEAVCDGGNDVIEGLASLADKSLIRRVEPGGVARSAPRFTMLETVREFGLEQLTASGEETATRDRHAAWCLDLAEQAWYASTHDATNPIWLDRVRAERDNLRAALEWLEPRDATRFVQLAGALWVLWGFGDHGLEGRAWLERALAHEAVPDPVRVRALQSAAIVAWSLRDVDWMAEVSGELLSLARALEDPGDIASGLYSLGEVALFQGDYERAEALLIEAHALFRDQGNAAWTAFTIYRLGLIAYAQGALDRATVMQEESLALHEAINDQLGSALSLDVLGAIACDRADLAGAAARYEASLPFWDDLGRNEGLAYWMTGVAVLAVAGGRPAQAARLLGVTEELLGVPSAPLRPPWHERRGRAAAAARFALSDDAFGQARAAGWALAPAEAIDEARVLLATLGGRKRPMNGSPARAFSRDAKRPLHRS